MAVIRGRWSAVLYPVLTSWCVLTSGEEDVAVLYLILSCAKCLQQFSIKKKKPHLITVVLLQWLQEVEAGEGQEDEETSSRKDDSLSELCTVFIFFSIPIIFFYSWHTFGL